MFLPRDTQPTRRVTLEYDRESTLLSVRPHEVFLGWDPDSLIGGFFSLGGLTREATEALVVELRRLHRLEGSMLAIRADGSAVEVDVVITPSGTDGYVGEVTFRDSEPS